MPVLKSRGNSISLDELKVRETWKWRKEKNDLEIGNVAEMVSLTSSELGRSFVGLSVPETRFVMIVFDVVDWVAAGWRPSPIS